MNFNYDKIQKLSDADLSTIMFKILIGFNIVQKGRKFINHGEDPREIPSYKEIFDDCQAEIAKSGNYNTPATNIMEKINLEIHFEAEKRAEKKKNFFSDIHIESRVEGLFQTTRQSEINDEIYF
jgi:hypothetical protein